MKTNRLNLYRDIIAVFLRNVQIIETRLVGTLWVMQLLCLFDAINAGDAKFEVNSSRFLSGFSLCPYRFQTYPSGILVQIVTPVLVYGL